MNKLKSRDSGRYFSVIVILLCGAVLSLWLFSLSRQWEVGRRNEEFRRLAGDRIHLFRERINDHFETIYSIASFFASSGYVERSEFKVFSQNIFKFRDAITFIFWIPRVPGKERVIFEQAQRKAGFSDFQIRALSPDLKVVDSKDEPLYFPVTFLESTDNSMDPLGVDFLSESVRRAALEAARDSGDPALTARTMRLGARSNNYSCLIFYPIYRKDTPVNTIEQRRDNLLGFIALIFEVKKTLENSRKGLSPIGIDMEIYDKTLPKNEELLYYFKSSLSQPDRSKKTGHYAKLFNSFVLQEEFDVGGRKWLIKAQAAPEFFENLNLWQSWIILLTGLLLTLFFAGFLFNLLQTSEKVRYLVLQRTNELNLANNELKAQIVKREESEIRERAAKDFLDKLINSAPDPIFVKDKDHRLVLVNDAMCRFMGLEKSQVIGKIDIDLFPKNESDVFWSSDREVLESAKDVVSEEFFTDSKGNRHIVITNKSLYIDQTGNKLIIGTIRDNTQIKVAQEQVVKAAKDWEDTFNAISDLVFIQDRSFVITKVNLALCKTLGLKPEDIVGKKCHEVMHKTGVPWLNCPFQKTLNDKQPHTEEVEDAHLGMPLLVTTSPILNETGELIGSVHIAKDITQIKKIELALRENKDQLQLLLDSAAEAIYGLDMNGNCTFCNNSCLRLLGYQYSQDLIGKNMHKQIHGKHSDGSEYPVEDCPIFRAFNNGDLAHVDSEVLWRSDGKSFPAEYWSYPQRREGKIVGAVVTFVDITERKKAEEALSNSEEKFRAIYESSSDALMLLDESGRFFDCNQRTLEVFGFKDRNEFLDKIPTEFSPQFQPNGKASDIAAQGHIKAALEKGADTFAWVHKRKDKVDFSAEVLLTSFMYKGKKMLQATVRDVSERLRMEEALRRQREEQQIILDSVPALVFFKDAENRFIRANRALEDAFGLPKEMIEGKSCFDLYSKDVAEQYWRDDKEVISTGIPKMGILETMNTPKGPVWFLIDKIPFRDAQGNIDGVIGFGVDITERKKAEEELVKSREQLVADMVKMESMVVSMVEGVIMLDDKGKIILLNPQSRWMLGFGFNEIVDENILFDKFKALKIDYAYKECQATHNFVSKEVANSQGHFLRCELNPVKNSSLETIGIVVILRDITKEKELDSLKSEFVSTVSHELRTPLSITKEGVSLVLDGIPGKINEKQRKILVTSRDNMDRLARIINSLLDISKIEAGKVELKREPVDIRGLVSKVAVSFEPRVKSKGLTLKLDMPDKPVMVYVDPDKIVQVLTNLIGNACKFTQEGSIEVSCYDKGDKVECSVSDTGPGLSPDDLSRVFEKFQQFSRAPGAGEKGTGLGLSIAKALVELHKGKVRVESEVGMGSKFSFILPKFTSAELFKEAVKQGISEALKKNLNMSLVIVSLLDFEQLRKEIPETKVHDILNGLEEVIKNALRREGDMVLRDTGEVIVVLVDCNKDDLHRVEGRLEQAVSDYLVDAGLKNKVKLRLGSSSYPDDARNEEELIRKAKA